MGIISYLIKKAIHAGILLALCGQLKSTILFLAEETLKVQKRGLISLSDLNYQIQGKKTYCASIHWPDERRCPKSKK